MEASLTKTLAPKHKTSVGHIYRKYRTRIQVEGTTYRGLRAIVEREGKEPLIATWGGIPLTWDIKATLNDRPQHIWHSRSELEQRLLAQVCEHCGATRMTDQIEVHHIRALKDLNKSEGRDKPSWVKMMAARRRKTMVLCHSCHVDVHAGRPLKPKRSRSRTEPLR
jgi:PHP family Zn ribbon phosphoesterase